VSWSAHGGNSRHAQTVNRLGVLNLESALGLHRPAAGVAEAGSQGPQGLRYMKVDVGQDARTTTPPRRRDLDGLRALIVLGLVSFHTARIFSFDPFYVSNDEKSLVLSTFVAWAVLWGMPLMFLVSGQTTWFSLSSRSRGQFVRERLRRLLVPFVFGLLVLVPPQVYLWLRTDPSYDEPYLHFYSRFFRVVWQLDFPWVVAPHPSTMLFEAGHLYYLYFLLTFTLLLTPVFARARGEAGLGFVRRAAGFMECPRAVLLLGLAAGALEAALQSENYGGWNRYAFLLYFIYGFLIAADARCAHAIRRHWRAALSLALLATLLGFAMYVRAANEGVYLGYGYELPNVMWRLLKGMGSWWWVSVLLALGGRLWPSGAGNHSRGCRGSGRWRQALVRYANEAVLPLYVLHHPIVVGVGYWVVQWQVGVIVKFGVISVVSLVLTLVAYEVLVKRFAVTRWLFGMKPGIPA